MARLHPDLVARRIGGRGNSGVPEDGDRGGVCSLAEAMADSARDQRRYVFNRGITGRHDGIDREGTGRDEGACFDANSITRGVGRDQLG